MQISQFEGETVVITLMCDPSMAATTIFGKPEILWNAFASFLASLFVGGLRYFLTKYSGKAVNCAQKISYVAYR